MTTPLEWAVVMCDKLGLPRSTNRVQALVAWAALEGGHWHNAARYNPLNTTRGVPGSHGWGGQIPIQVYPSWDAGVTGAALTIKQSNMAPIFAALKADADPAVTLQYVKQSPWGTVGFDPNAWKGLFAAYQNQEDNPASTLSTFSWKKGIAIGAGLGGLAAVLVAIFKR